MRFRPLQGQSCALRVYFLSLHQDIRHLSMTDRSFASAVALLLLAGLVGGLEWSPGKPTTIIVAGTSVASSTTRTSASTSSADSTSASSTTTSKTTTTPTITTTPTSTTNNATTTNHTTTSHETTSTNSTDTTVTTMAPRTTTVAHEEKYYYNVSTAPGSKTYCILFKGVFSFNITYQYWSDYGVKVSTVNIKSPGQPRRGSKVTGKCGNKQYMTFDWDGNSNITMNFTKSKDNTTWSLDEVTAVILMDSKRFPDALDPDSAISIVGHFHLNPSDIPVNSSYSCDSSFKSNPTNVTWESVYKIKYIGNVSLALQQDFILEAYNLKPQGNFTTATICSTPSSHTTAIVVGCVVGGLAVVGIVAFAVVYVRRKKNSKYTEI